MKSNHVTRRNGVHGLAVALLSILLSFSACTKENIKADYVGAEAFESALNEGEDTIGKSVYFTVDEVHPDSAFGYNLWAGEHLNFISEEDPGVFAGDSLTVRVGSVRLYIGSWLIGYEK